MSIVIARECLRAANKSILISTLLLLTSKNYIEILVQKFRKCNRIQIVKFYYIFIIVISLIVLSVNWFSFLKCFTFQKHPLTLHLQI